MPRLLAGARRKLFTRVVLIACAQAVCGLALARVLRAAALAAETPGSRALPALLLAAVALLGPIVALRWSERVQAEKLGQSYVHRLRRALYRRVANVDAGAAARVHRGALLLRFIGDLGSVSQWVSNGVARLTVAGVLCVVLLVAIAVDDWRLALVVGVTLATGAALMHLVGLRLRAALVQMRRRSGRLARHIAEKSQTLVMGRAFARSRRDEHRMRRQSASLKRSRIARARMAGWLLAIADATAAAVLIAVLAVAVLMLRHAATGVGQLIATVTLVSFLAMPLRDLARAYDYWCRYQVARRKLAAFLREHASRPRDGAAALPADNLVALAATGSVVPTPCIVEALHVNLGNRLYDVSLAIGQRERVAVWGAGGSGKSSLLAALAGWQQIDSGEVLVDGHHHDALGEAALRADLGIYSADLPLVRGSVLRNLLYRCPTAQPGEIAHVSALFELAPLLQATGRERGLKLIEEGRNLATSDRQRLMLARAFIGAPRLLLLDDLDTITDRRLRAQLRHAIGIHPGAVLMVTQSADLAQLARRHLRMSAGQLSSCSPAQWATPGNGAPLS